MVLLAGLVLLGWWVGLVPEAARGQCPAEVNAVMLVSGIYPGTDLQITRLHVARVGTVTNPTAEVLFAGTVVWMGDGHVVLPATATHACSPVPGAPALLPVAVAAFPSPYWSEDPGPAEAFAQAGVTLAAQTDFLRSMGGCGAYSVVGFTYTPAVGGANPYVAGVASVAIHSRPRPAGSPA